MTTRAIERVDQWETRSFTGGYRGLHELAEAEFSGVVRAGAATLCMLNGTVVGVLDGSIEDFEAAEGTAYAAPTPALPLLVVMQERSDEVRAKYYTEDTPLSKVDETLADGKFTGFVELSENVLSGDYYAVYHAGRSMSVAFVGERGELLRDEEAFERADDEVGIYEVRPVDIDVIEVPDVAPESDDLPSSDLAAGGGVGGDEVDASTEDPPVVDEETGETTREDETAREDETTREGESTPAEREDDDVAAETTGQDGAVDNSSHEATADTESDAAEADSDTESAGTDTDAPPQPADTTTDGASDTADSSRPDRQTAGERQSAPPESDSARTREADTDQTAAGTQTEVEQTESTDDPERSGNSDRSGASSTTESRSIRSQQVDRQRTDTTASNHPGAAAARQTQTTSSVAAGTPSDLEIRTIPSLDPDKSWGTDENGPKASAAPVPPVDTGHAGSASQDTVDHRRERNESTAHSQSDISEQSESEESPRQGTATTQSPSGSDAETDNQPSTRTQNEPNQTDGQVRELKAQIEEREARIEDLEDRVETTEANRDELKAERDELQAERDELREELSDVRAELESLREERDSLEANLEELDVNADTVTHRMSRQEAIEGTNLFVRYDSKSAPTLAAARESGASQSDVKENLSVEYHTQFEVEGAHVEGQPFEQFLRDTMEHRYVTWVVEELLFEIRDTGHREAMADLYDALPHIDRVELNGSVGVEYDEDGQTKRSQESFDVVFRDRMGNPLVVANLNDSRQAATENQMNSLVTAATRVGETSDSLAGAMFVTSSFFEPAALETTAEATGGGLLSRDKRESFVKLSRKQGYHLCLAEARDDQFHMAVPEL